MSRFANIFVLFILIAWAAVPCAGQDKPRVIIHDDNTSKKTEKELRRQLEADPANPSILNAIALELQYRNKSDDALEMFEKAVVLDPSNPGFFADYALAYADKIKPYASISRAIKRLEKYPDDAEAMFLGAIGNYNLGKFSSALSNVESALAHSPGYAPAYALKSETLVREYSFRIKPDAQALAFLRQSIEVLELCLSQCVGIDKDLLVQGIEVRKAFESFNDEKGDDKSREDEPGYSRLDISSKPRPGYTNTARKRNVSGAVNLEVFFNADGKVGSVLVKKALGAGLTSEAVEAVRGIKYTPASMDGKSLTEVKSFTYRFSIF